MPFESTASLSATFLLFVAAMLGGALNSVAGGGSFLSFPSLIFSGVPPINANATSTIALWPGTAASVGAYRRELARLNRNVVIWLGSISLLGGLLGALLLLHTAQSTFSRLVPFLLLAATVLFAISPTLTRALRTRRGVGAVQSPAGLLGISFVQLVIAVYGGFFGGGIGIMMLAALGLMGFEDIHEMNALKTLLATCINGIAVVTFVAAGAIFWPQAILMIVGAIIGGFGGASYARKIDGRYIRGFVLVVGSAMTTYFFVR